MVSTLVNGCTLNLEMSAEPIALICFMSAFTVFKRTKERSIGSMMKTKIDVQMIHFTCTRDTL